MIRVTPFYLQSRAGSYVPINQDWKPGVRVRSGQRLFVSDVSSGQVSQLYGAQLSLVTHLWELILSVTEILPPPVK